MTTDRIHYLTSPPTAEELAILQDLAEEGEDDDMEGADEVEDKPESPFAPDGCS